MSTASPDLSCFDHLEPVFVETGMALEADPEAWTNLWSFPELRAIAYIDVPERFNPYPASRIGIDQGPSPYAYQLALYEYLSRFDASCLMALPGPSLCTRIILALGTEDQIDFFFSRFAFTLAPHWAFFAVTEPEVGSDVSAMRSRLSGPASQRRLHADKILICAGQHASIGLVCARMEDSPTLRFVLIEPFRYPHAVSLRPIPAFGLAGARLSRLSIRDLPISSNQIIGGERSSLRDSLPGILSVFERQRPIIGAMALGTARGIINGLERAGVPSEALGRFKLEHASLCRLMHRYALNFEQSRLRGHESSQFKYLATSFAARVARSVPRLLGTKLLSFPLLLKKYRDVFAFEYMEGTSNMQLLNAFRTYVASRGTHDFAS